MAGKIIDNPPNRIPVDTASRDAEREFETLAERWHSERPRGADLGGMVGTLAYQDVIRMGGRAIRPILLRLRQRPEHWFYALHKITGENPVPPASEGKRKLMAEAWLQWGKERGYVSDLD